MQSPSVTPFVRSRLLFRNFHYRIRADRQRITNLPPGICNMDSDLTNKIRLVTPEYNGRSRFQRSEPPAPTEEASLATSENDKARTCLSLYRFLRQLSVPCLLVA